MRPKTIVGILLLAGFTILVVRSFTDQLGGYTNFAGAAAVEGNTHVIGAWERERPSGYDPTANVFSFWMRDDAGEVRQVNYHSPRPANFEEAEEVVVRGSMQGDVFTADHILIKCPSKYNEGREFQDAEAHPQGVVPAGNTQSY